MKARQNSDADTRAWERDYGYAPPPKKPKGPIIALVLFAIYCTLVLKGWLS